MRRAFSTGNICREGLVVSNFASLEEGEKSRRGVLSAEDLIINCYLIYSESRPREEGVIFWGGGGKEQNDVHLAPGEKLTSQQALDC